MTTLVTGGTGFVGSAVVRRLLEADHDVRVLARAGSNRANLEGLPVDTVIGDLRDPGSLERALLGCDALFHVAADYRLWALDPRELYESNVDGSVNIVRAAGDAGVQRIVYTSSVATLGLKADGSPGDERTPVDEAHMIGHYKRSKFIAEREVRALARREQLPLVVVNPSTPVGPRDIKPTPTGRVIRLAAAGRMPAYVDTGLNLVHVDDVAEGHRLAYERGRVGERYILGGEDWTLRRLLEVVSEITGRRRPLVKLSPGAVLPLAYVSQALATLMRSRQEPLLVVDAVRMSRRHMFFSSGKATAELGYRPRPAREGVEEAIRWFAGNGYL